MEGELSPLSPTERDMFTRASTSPLDVIQGEVKAYIDRMIEFAAKKAAAGSWIAGDFKTIGKDLTAQTGEYVYEDESGQWLYCNGVAVSKTTYADLYAFFGASAYAADSGGNFLLPDARGRALFFTGTNAATQRNDNDGTALANRGAVHVHTSAVSGAPGVGSLAISPNPHSHGFVRAVDAGVIGQSGSDRTDFSLANSTTDTTSLSITGAPSAGTLAVGIGTGGSTDAPSHLFVGSLLVKF